MVASREFPNGRVVAFWGTATSCKKQVMDGLDWIAAQKTPNGPNGETWALSAQSGTVIDGSPQGRMPTPATPYSGYYGNS